jgi:hypothetical protein
MLHKNFGRQRQNFSHKKDIKFIREYVIHEYVNFGSHPYWVPPKTRIDAYKFIRV